MEVRPIDANYFAFLAKKLADVNGRHLDSSSAKTALLFADMASNEKILPTIDYAPVIHANWIMRDDGEGLRIVCSRCGKESKEEKPFCAECGAKMDGGKEDNDKL